MATLGAEPDTHTDTHTNKVALVGLFAGPLLAGAVLLLAPRVHASAVGDAVVFTSAGRATLALMVWMATWWLTEAVHISVTALLPLVVLPLVTTGVDTGAGPPLSAGAAMKAAALPYADPFIGLFLGGFMVALAMERCGLHRRIALAALRRVGTAPAAIVGGFMVVSAVMSMWVSNTATAVMLLPIGLSVVRLTEGNAATAGADDGRHRHVPVCLLLGIAYAASIGGIGTLIGTPPNLLLAQYLSDELDVQVSFVRWLAVGVPLVVVFVPIAWFLLTRVLYPVPREPIAGGRAVIDGAWRELGRARRAEWSVFLVFIAMALAWIFRPLLVQLPGLAGLTDAGIAITAAIVLFVLPAGDGARVLDWETAARAPWGILILFGGGLALADAVRTYGVAEFLGSHAGAVEGWPAVLVVLVVATGVIFLTELTSNTATTAALLPILAAMAGPLGVDPVVLLTTAAMAASCAFMLPVATPPNAVIFGSGHLAIRDMSRAGIWLNLIAIILVTLMAYGVVARVLL